MMITYLNLICIKEDLRTRSSKSVFTYEGGNSLETTIEIPNSETMEEDLHEAPLEWDELRSLSGSDDESRVKRIVYP